MTEIAERLPPRNLEVEQALLGAILLENRAYEKIAGLVGQEDFFVEPHRRIFAQIEKAIRADQPADPVTLKACFEHDGSLDAVGGTAYIAKLAASAVTTFNADDFAKTVRDLAVRRRAMLAADELAGGMANLRNEEDTEALLARHVSEIDGLTVGRDIRRSLSASDVLAGAIAQAEAAWKSDGAVTGLSTGLAKLDHAIGGLHPGDLTILAGRPSQGKTALATTIGMNAAKAGRSAFLASLEMSAEQIGSRLLAMETGIGGDRLRRGDVSEADFAVMVEAQGRLESLPFTVDECGGGTVEHLRMELRRVRRARRLDLVIVDYLQLFGSERYRENRVQQLTEITRTLKRTAVEYGVPVLALSQLSRAVENRDDKRPQLSDLRDSGSIEQDADVVLFLYRDEYYLSRAEPRKRVGQTAEDYAAAKMAWEAEIVDCRDKAEIIVAKNRHGPAPRTAHLHFDSARTAFADERTAPAGADEGLF